MMSPGSSVSPSESEAIKVGNVEDHVGRVAVLAALPVDAQPDATPHRIAKLVHGDDERPERTGAVERLAFEILPAMAALHVARSHVVQDRVTEDVVHGR